MRVGVVGAGITGLTLVHHLRERGVEAVAMEATDEPGGVIRSERVEGYCLEYGPQRTRLTDGVEALVEELALSEELIEADPSLPLYVYADGKLRTVPFSVGTFLATDLLSWRGKLRLLAEPLTAAGSEDETAAELFTRKFGREAYENLIGPLFGGIYGSDPAEMPAGYAPAPLLKLEARAGSLLKPAVKRALKNERTPPISFESGLQALPEALYERNEPAVNLDRPVEAIHDEGDAYVLASPAGDELVDRVVLTPPADAAAELLAAFAPDAADRLERLDYNPLATVHLAADADREGFGYQVRRDEDLRTLGVSWNASLFDRHGSDGETPAPDDGKTSTPDDDGTSAPDDDGTSAPDDGAGSDREGVYTCFLGGMDDPGILEEDDETLGAIAAEEFERVMDAEARVLDVTRLRRGFPAWDTSWTALDGLELPDGVYLATNYTDRMGVPGRIRQAESLADRFAREQSPRDRTPTARP